MAGGSTTTTTAPWGEITGGGGVNLGGIAGVGQQPFLEAGCGGADERVNPGAPSD